LSPSSAADAPSYQTNQDGSDEFEQDDGGGGITGDDIVGTRDW
jgi:hypothetical protein